jgi:hypothetical protein
MHDIAGSVQPIIGALEVERPDHFDNKIYVNFNSSNHVERRGLRDLLLSRGIPVQSPNYSADGRLSALVESRRANFVLCPRGVG